MKKLIFIFVVLFGCGILNVEAKRKVILTPISSNTPRPTDLTGDPIPILDGEYDSDTLTISICDYWGNAEVYIKRLPSFLVIDSAEETVVSETQFDFSIADYVESDTYQIVVELDNGETYIGEFEYRLD